MRKSIVILALLLLSMLFVPAAEGQNDSLRVIITMPKAYYNVSEVAEITVHVYDKGVPADADYVNLSIEDVDVNVTRIGTGLYTYNYTVTADDDYQYIWVDVIRGTDDDYDIAYIYLYGEYYAPWELDVSVELDDPLDRWVGPGDAINFTVTVEYNGTPVDADILRVSVDNAGLNYTHVGLGAYAGSYVVPEEYAEGKERFIRAHAYAGNFSGGGDADFTVLFFSAYYHEHALTPYFADFDVYVTDDLGWPLEGAYVQLEYENDENYTTPRVEVSGFTDMEGKTRFNISYEEDYYIMLEGLVTYHGVTQNIMGGINLGSQEEPTLPDPRQEGFDVIWDYLADMDNLTEVRNFIAYYDGIPLADYEILYYITDGYSDAPSEVIANGTVPTDADGKFNLTFDHSFSLNVAMFEASVPLSGTESDWDADDGTYYAEDMVVVYGNELYLNAVDTFDWDPVNVSIETGDAWLGAWNTVNVTFEGRPDGAYRYCYWLVGDYGDITVYHEGWTYWDTWGGVDNSIELWGEGGHLTGRFQLPSVIPVDSPMTIIAGWYDYANHSYHINRLVFTPAGLAQQPERPMELVNISIADGSGLATCYVGQGIAFEHLGQSLTFVLKDVDEGNATLLLLETNESYAIPLWETIFIDTDGDGEDDLSILLEDVNYTQQSATFLFDGIYSLGEDNENWDDALLYMGIALGAVVLVIFLVVMVILMKSDQKPDWNVPPDPYGPDGFTPPPGEPGTAPPMEPLTEDEFAPPPPPLEEETVVPSEIRSQEPGGE